jgi:hypothetical protein
MHNPMGLNAFQVLLVLITAQVSAFVPLQRSFGVRASPSYPSPTSIASIASEPTSPQPQSQALSAMEVWLDTRDTRETPSTFNELGVDRWIVSSASATYLWMDGSRVMMGQQLVGAHVHIDSESYQKARSLIGSVQWLVLSCETWSMIPLENLISERQSTPTKIAVFLRTPEEAQGAGWALEIGVDALIVKSEVYGGLQYGQYEATMEAALIVKAQRGERQPMPVMHIESDSDLADRVELVPMQVCILIL